MVVQDVRAYPRHQAGSQLVRFGWGGYVLYKDV